MLTFGCCAGADDAWANLVQPQMFADNYTQAAAMGLNAGMDHEVSRYTRRVVAAIITLHVWRVASVSPSLYGSNLAI